MPKANASKQQLEEIAGPPITIVDGPPQLQEDRPEPAPPPRARVGDFDMPYQTDCYENWPTSLDLSDPAQRERVANAALGADVEIKPGAGGEIALHDFVIMPESRLDDKTGFIVEYHTLVLFDAEGRTLKTTGEVVVKRLSQWLRLWPDGEWRKLVVTVKEYPSREDPKRSYHDARVRYVP